MTATIIDGSAVSQQIRNELAVEVAAFRERTGVIPHLAAVLVGEDPASAVYVRSKQKACETTGLKSTLHKLPPETTQQQLLDLVHELNGNSDVHGILVQLPLPKQIDQQVVLDAVTPLKDVDATWGPATADLVADTGRRCPRRHSGPE